MQAGCFFRSWIAPVAVLLGPGLAAAQSEPTTQDVPEPPPGIEEITVIGETLEIGLQHEPISVISFSGEDLMEARISDVRDLADYTPNLEIKTGGAASNATLFIRGIGLNDFNANASSSVAVFNDGIYVNSPAGQLFQLFDVESVDVLRGPQGTLYGRNVTAGAIQVKSVKPSDEFSSRLTATYGNFNLREFDGAISIPIVPEWLSLRTAGRIALRDGITKNTCAGAPRQGQASRGACNRGTSPFHGTIPDGLPGRVNDVDAWAGRALLRTTPLDSLDLLVNVHGGQNRGDARQNQSRGTLPNPGDPNNPIGRNKDGYADIDNDPYAGAYDLVEDENLDLFGASLTATWELESLKLTSITALEQNERAILDNSDASPSFLIFSKLSDRAKQWSQELRFDSQLGGDFEWNAGLLFITETARADNTFQATGSALALPARQRFEQSFLHAAGFAYLSYQLTEELRFEAGARAGWEHKDFEIHSIRFQARNPSFTQNALDGEDDVSWTPITGDVVATWSPLDVVDLYAKYSRGWKTGHFNGGAINASELIEPVEPEDVNAFEVGIRSSWFDDRVTLNAAVYYYDYTNYQVFALQNQPDAIPLAKLINAQDVESRGFEVDLKLQPEDGLRWDLALGWVDSAFGTFTTSIARVAQNSNVCGGPPTCVIFDNDDFTGNPLPAAPKFNFTTALEWELPLAGGRFGSLTPRLDAIYQSTVYFDHQKDAALSQEPFWLMHARLSYRLPNQQVSIAAWVRNLTDQAYLRQSFDVREIAETILDVYGEPRMYGVTVTVSF